MATVVSNPMLAYAASLISGTAMAQSSNLTVALNLNTAWQINIPFFGIQPNTTGISAGWEVYAYRSSDGAGSYTTVAVASMSIARATAASQKDQLSMRLETGQYLLRIISGGNGTAGTWSFAVTTQDIITAIGNL